ncbi:MAG: S8 family serine peptidase [Candidatus Polarisedimenticolia bacterium]
MRTSRAITTIPVRGLQRPLRGAVAQCLALIVGLLAWSATPAQPITPPEWIPELTGWTGDVNANGVADSIDNADPNISVFDGIVLDLNAAPSPTDLADFEAIGNVAYVAQHLSIVVLHGVPRSWIPNLAAHPRVAMVEQPVMQTTLDVGARAVRSLPSATFSPQTAAEIGIDGTGVTIVIMDTGVDNGGGPGITHSALPAARNAALPEGGFDGCAAPPAYGDPDDLTFHGTHVAGIAVGGAYVDVGSGLTLKGVASGAHYADVKVCCGLFCPAVAIAAGFDAILDKKVPWDIRVVNMSWGGLCGITNGLDAFSMFANALADAGIVPVASAGNSGFGGLCSPCAGDKVVCVASDNDVGTVPLTDDVISAFSSRGPRPSDGDGDPLDELKPDLAAPGSLILAPANNTVAGSMTLSGTSMASPHVAGGAALAIQGRPGLPPSAIKTVLKQTAADMADMDGGSFPGLDPLYDTAFGEGILNAFAAASCASDAECQDGDACNGAEVCVAGVCQPGSPPDCDDGSICTVDSCSPLSGCLNIPAADAEIPSGLDRTCSTADDNVTLFGPDGFCNTADDTCGDGVVAGDVCPGHVDPAQADHDGDAVGDMCDPTACLTASSGVFRSRGSMTQAREGHAAALMSDGRVLVAGGGFTPPSEVYSPATRSFSATSAMSVAPNRTGHTMTPLTNGRVLVAAGWNPFGGGSLNSAQIYDPLTGFFTAAGNLGTARNSHTATRLSSGQVLVASGATTIGGRTATAELYEPASGIFSPTGSLLEAREGHVAALLADGRVLVASGRGDSGVLASAEIFNPATGTWSFTDSMNVGREFAQATALADGRVLVTGGRRADATILSSAEIYDPATGHFSLVGPMAGARMHYTMTMIPGGRVLIAGGASALGGVPTPTSPSAELFDPATDSFTTVASMLTPRMLHIASPLANGHVLIAGGNQILSSSEQFVPGEQAVVSVPDGLSLLINDSTAQVPVLTSDLTGLGIVSADFTLSFNPSVVQPSGVVTTGPVSAGCSIGFTPSFNSVSVSISCPGPMSGSGDLAVVSFDFAGGFNEITPLLLTSASLSPGLSPACSENGSLQLVQNADLTGMVRYYRDAALGTEPGSIPVALVSIRLTGTGPSVPATTSTLAAGTYTLAGKRLGETYAVTPAKTADFQSGVTSYDAALNAQDVVGLITLSPAQLLAADVSGNGRNTAFDSALIAEMAVGSLGRFPVATMMTSDWFALPVPAPALNQMTVAPSPSTGVAGAIGYAPLVQDVAGQDFLAGLFGDVSGNWPSGAPGFTSGGTASLQGPSTPPRFVLGDLEGATGSIVQVHLAAEGIEGAIAVDLDLRFKESVLRPIAVAPGTAAAGFTLNANLATPGRARIGLFSASPLKAPGTLAVISFEIVGRPGSQSVLKLSGLADEGRIPVSSSTAHARVSRP